MSSDDRSEMEAARLAGLAKRHETREARAVRRQVADEITQALEHLTTADVYSDEAKRAFRLCAEIAHQFGSVAREIGSRDPE